MKLFLHKDDGDDWYFSMIPFEELESEDNVISYPSLNIDLDIIYEILNKKDVDERY